MTLEDNFCMEIITLYPTLLKVASIKTKPQCCHVFSFKSSVSSKEEWTKCLSIDSTFHIVYVEWASRVNFVTIFGDLY